MSHGPSDAAIAEAVRAVIVTKIVDHLRGQPNTENVDRLESQIAKSCATIRTTAWGGRHVCLPLALPNNALSRATDSTLTDCNLSQPIKFNSAIKGHIRFRSTGPQSRPVRPLD